MTSQSRNPSPAPRRALASPHTASAVRSIASCRAAASACCAHAHRADVAAEPARAEGAVAAIAASNHLSHARGRLRGWASEFCEYPISPVNADEISMPPASHGAANLAVRRRRHRSDNGSSRSNEIRHVPHAESSRDRRPRLRLRPALDAVARVQSERDRGHRLPHSRSAEEGHAGPPPLPALPSPSSRRGRHAGQVVMSSNTCAGATSGQP